MHIFAIIFFLCTTHICMPAHLPYKAIVVVPVADLIGKPIHTLYPSHSIEDAYLRIPLCGGNKNRWHSCPRTEQLLFNEIVDVIEEKDKEVKVRVSRVYYITETSNTKQTDYWTLAHNLIPLKSLDAANINQHMFPAPLDFNHTIQNNRATVALLLPHYDIKTGFHFSAGTRFICAKTASGDTDINVFAYNHHKSVMQKIKIPKNICIFYDKKRTHEEMRTLFVSCAQQWAHLNHGFIPYLWGGGSVIHAYSGPFKEKTKKYNGQDLSFFEYTNNKHKPHTGLDCSGLVARAAQLAGIPYFYKNTYTLAHYMQPIQKGEHLHIGDLIWTPGHVMIISDIDKNLLVEARSYFQGYGKVHEIELHKVFKNIHTYEDLECHFFDKKTIERIDLQGTVRNSIPNFLLLKLESVWKST